MDMFYLWSFAIGDLIVVTRGRTQDEAADHVCNNLPRGLTVTFRDCNFVNAAEQYSKTYPQNWLHTKPIWLLQREQEQTFPAFQE
jgi:hypothetical protein